MIFYFLVFNLAQLFFILVDNLLVYCRHHLGPLTLSTWVFNCFQIFFGVLLLFSSYCLLSEFKLFFLFRPDQHQPLSVTIGRPNRSVGNRSAIRTSRLMASIADSTVIVSIGLPHSIFLRADTSFPLLLLLINSFLVEEGLKIFFIVLDNFLVMI